MSEDEGRTQGERDQQNQGDSGEAVVGDQLSLAGSVGLFGAVPAGMEKSVFEGPMFRQIHPAVVLVLPAAVSQLADDWGGKYLLGCEVTKKVAKGLMDTLAQTAITEVKKNGIFVLPGIGRLVRVDRRRGWAGILLRARRSKSRRKRL